MKNRLQMILVLACVMVSARAQAQTYNFYFGDIHSHTWYSDGNKEQNPSTYTKPVARAITYARDTANNMDFLGVSEHNHNESLNLTMPYWRSGFVEADSVNQDGVFVGFYGQEWGTISTGGHVLVYGTDKLFGWNPGLYDVYVAKGDYTRLFDSLKKYNAFSYLAHPDASDYDNIFSIAYNANWDSVISGVALKSGPALTAGYTESNPSSGNYETEYHTLLGKGYHVAPCGNQDNHYTNFGMLNQQRTVVLATSLTKANIVDALRNRRAYASEDHNLQLRLEVGTHQMGELVSQAGPIPIRVKVVDPDNAITSIVLRYGIPGSGSAPATLSSASNVDSLVISQPQGIGTTYYYYAYVTNLAGRHAWSAPIWVTVPTGPLPGAFALSAPANSSGNQPVSGTLSWDPSQDATQYDVYLDTNNPPTTLVSSNQAGTSYNYGGLLNNTLYRWKVVAENSNGTTVASGAPWSFVTIVAAPGSFALTSPSNGAASQPVTGTLSWQASASASQYDVYLDTNLVPATLVSAGQSGTTYDYSGLSHNENYYWKIVAKNIVDSVVGTGAPWIFTTAGPVPTSFALYSPANNAVDQPVAGTLLWNSSGFAVNYDLYLDENNPPTTLVGPNLPDTSYAYASLTPGATYYWKVVAKNVDGTTVASNSPHSFTLANVPLAASNIFSDNVTTTSLDLIWTDNAGNETGYRVYRADNAGGPYSQAGPDLAVDATSCTDTGLNINQRYYYRVIPFNGLGEGEYVSLNVATLAALPGAPQVSDPGYFGLRVVVDPSGNPPLTTFSIRIANDTSSQYVQSNGTVGGSPAWRTFSEWGDASGVTVSGLHPCKEYTLTVAARNADDVLTVFSNPAIQLLPCYALSQSTLDGWNLMSLPVTLPDTRRATVFPGSASEAFFYQGSYVSRETLTYGEGFWLKYNNAQMVNLEGEPRLDDSLQLRQGWNIIGSFATTVATSSLNSQPNGIVVSNYFGFDGAYTISDSLRPLKGYWVKSSAPGLLVLAPSLRQEGTQALRRPAEVTGEMSSFSFEDHTGHRQTLYVSAEDLKDRSLPLHELPPPPPGNLFDVRFSTQKFVETVAANLGYGVQHIPIDLQGETYPLRISWNIRSSNDIGYYLDDGTRKTALSGIGEMMCSNRLKQIILEVRDGTSNSLPEQFALHQNYPNPFNPATVFRYDLPTSSPVRFIIYNVLGAEVATLVDGVQEAGYKEITWDASAMPSGLYYYRLTAGSFVGFRKLLIIK